MQRRNPCDVFAPMRKMCLVVLGLEFRHLLLLHWSPLATISSCTMSYTRRNEGYGENHSDDLTNSSHVNSCLMVRIVRIMLGIRQRSIMRCLDTGSS